MMPGVKREGYVYEGARYAMSAKIRNSRALRARDTSQEEASVFRVLKKPPPRPRRLSRRLRVIAFLPLRHTARHTAIIRHRIRREGLDIDRPRDGRILFQRMLLHTVLYVTDMKCHCPIITAFTSHVTASHQACCHQSGHLSSPHHLQAH